jgi:hypothetical protein
VAYSGSKSDLKLMEELARDNVRGSTFGGRVGKLQRVAKFEAEQLAKYGIQSGLAVKPVEVRIADKKKDDSKRKKDEDEDNGEKKKKKKKKAEKRKKAEKEKEKEKKGTSKKDDSKKKKGKTGGSSSSSDRSDGDVVLEGAAYEGEQSASTRLRDWWSKAGFAWGGVVGSKRERDVGDDDSAAARTKKKKSGFTEDDQEALFKSAHEHGVQKGTKRGLGGTGIIKTEWTGERIVYADDDDNDAMKKSTIRRAEKKPIKEKKSKKEKKPKKEKSLKKASNA